MEAHQVNNYHEQYYYQHPSVLYSGEHEQFYQYNQTTDYEVKYIDDETLTSNYNGNIYSIKNELKDINDPNLYNTKDENIAQIFDLDAQKSLNIHELNNICDLQTNQQYFESNSTSNQNNILPSMVKYENEPNNNFQGHTITPPYFDHSIPFHPEIKEEITDGYYDLSPGGMHHQPVNTYYQHPNRILPNIFPQHVQRYNDNNLIETSPDSIESQFSPDRIFLSPNNTVGQHIVPSISTDIKPLLGEKSKRALRLKTHHCSVCNRWFTTTGHLKRHFKTSVHKNAEAFYKASGLLVNEVKPEPLEEINGNNISSEKVFNDAINESDQDDLDIEKINNVIESIADIENQEIIQTPYYQLPNNSNSYYRNLEENNYLQSISPGNQSKSQSPIISQPEQNPALFQPLAENLNASPPLHPYDFSTTSTTTTFNNCQIQVNNSPPNIENIYQMQENTSPTNLSTNEGSNYQMQPNTSPTNLTTNDGSIYQMQQNTAITNLSKNTDGNLKIISDVRIAPANVIHTETGRISTDSEKQISTQPNNQENFTTRPSSNHSILEENITPVYSPPILSSLQTSETNEAAKIPTTQTSHQQQNLYYDQKPVAHIQPIGPIIQPVRPIQLVGPIQPVGPSHPVESIHPVSLIQRVEPRKPVIKRRKISTPVNSVNGKIECLLCCREFTKACYLTQHNKSFHIGETPFRCLKCGKRFLTEDECNTHIAKHQSEDKPFKCEKCPKQFHHKTDLRRHRDSHTGYRAHVCNHCNKGFSRKDHLRQHIETHNNKPVKFKK